MKSRPDDAGPREDVPGPSELVEKILALLEDAECPQYVNDSVSKMIEFWEQGEVTIDYTNDDAGFLLTGVDDKTGLVMVNLGKDKVGHIGFTPSQARGFADMLIKKAREADALFALGRTFRQVNSRVTKPGS
jgi:hypothetical protein